MDRNYSEKEIIENEHNLESLGFNAGQISEIKFGLDEGVDVSIYANPKFNQFQMSWICRGLEKGIDASIYANLGYAEDQMAQLYEGLIERLDVSALANPAYNSDQMAQIIIGLEYGLDVSAYANPEFDVDQMVQIRCRLEHELIESRNSSNTSSFESKYLENEYIVKVSEGNIKASKYGLDKIMVEYSPIYDKKELKLTVISKDQYEDLIKLIESQNKKSSIDVDSTDI